MKIFSKDTGTNQEPNGIAWIKEYRARLGLGFLALIIVGAVGIWAYRFSGEKTYKPQWSELPQGLIADKVSQSAALAITLPPEIKVDTIAAEKSITFDPPVAGEWTPGETEQKLLFRPEQKLDLGKHYRISVIAGTTHLQKDFLVDEDPQVVAIFPKNETEAPETAEITIEFNRPMVPLTSLDELSKGSLPVKINPPTAGKFKWVTTRTLKFLPEKRLMRSSRYSVEIEKGFISMDGLPVKPTEAHFTTRPLRYGQLHHEGITLYDEAVSIHFNQPIDIEKTEDLIAVKKLDEKGENIPFVVEYGTRWAQLEGTDRSQEYTDKSILYIYQRQDRFGRDKLWDNTTSYAVSIKGAVPLEGDVTLEEPRTVTIQVPDILAGVRAESPRSDWVGPDLFDHQGKLILEFYEEIDKDRSAITAPNLKNIAYGEKCKTDEIGEEIRIGDECEKEPNQKELLLSFEEKSLTPGQSFEVVLEKIVNVRGLELNREPLRQNVRVFPPLEILRSIPAEGGEKASVTELIICTNTPLDDATPENFYQRFKSNVSVGRWSWDQTFRAGQFDKCAEGQFENHIRYALRPETRYELQLNPVDHFGQTTEKKLNFTSDQIASIYRKFNSLQKAYNVTSPRRTKLTYAVENLEYVDLHVCQVAAGTMLQYITPETWPAATLSGAKLNCQKTWTKKIDLPVKYWSLNYFQVELKDIIGNALGYYVLSFSHPELREQVYNPRTSQTEPGAQLYERTFLNITGLTVQEKKVEVEGVAEGEPKESAERSTERKILTESDGNLYWLSRIDTLDPVAEAKVEIFQKTAEKYSLFQSVTTDASGVARAKAYAGEGAAIINAGADSTLVSAAGDKFQWTSSYRGGDKTYIYSDRPIYRPGQEVFLKGLYRIGYDGVYEIFRGKPVPLTVSNSRNEPVFTKELELNDRGTFNTAFTLPQDAPLGTYYVEALGGYYTFDVEEYVPAAFKLDLRTDKEEYIAGEDFTLDLDANYYFGVPVEGGQVEYSIVAQDYYFDRYQDGNFQFGAGWYYSPEGYYGDSFILRGRTAVSTVGKAQIASKLDFDKFFRDEARNHSKVFVIRTTVTNSSGQAVSGETSFIVHRGEFYLGVNLEKPYFGKDEPNKILLKSVDTQGQEKAVRNISGKINKVTWEYFKRQEVDGGYYYHSEKKLDTVEEFEAATDGQGNFTKDFSTAEEGEYELTVTATDDRGNPVTATRDFYVYGPANVEVRPLNNESLDLAVENPRLEVGEKGKIIIKSPYAKAKALIAVERGRVLKYDIVDIDRNFYDHTFEIKEEYIPNFYVTVLLLSPLPEVRFGQAEFFVNTTKKTISVEAKPNKNHYLPGEEVVLDVMTRDSEGKPVAAEVSVAVADLSVLALVGNPKKDPVSFFYDGRPLGVTTSSNLKNILTEAEIPAGTKGGGGAEPGDLAKKKRGIFKDTAHWNATVLTDGNGRAQVKFTLPDNLTTWQVESLGLTTDTKLGVGYGEFTARKELMISPLYPRFVIPGDEFVIGGKIFNQTGSAQKLEVQLESPSLEIQGDAATTERLDTGETKNVYFKVRAPLGQEKGDHKFTITAKNDAFEDSVENSFPVKRNETYEAVATSNYTAELSADEYVWLPDNVLRDKGGITLKASATLAGVVPEALDYLVGYPYGCTEQMVSKLAGVAAVKRFTSLKNLGDKLKFPAVEFEGQSYSADDVVEIGLSRIFANQTPEGGFAYYPGLLPDFYLSLHVLDALGQLRAAGYTIDDAAESRAVQWVARTFREMEYFSSNRDTLILVGYVFSTLPTAANEFAVLKPRILALAQDEKFLNEDISNLSLAALALLGVENTSEAFAKEVFDILENRIVVDGRGAYLGTGVSSLWAYYETPVKDTALLLEAISKAKREFPQTDKLLRWLQNSRSKDGSWGSTNNTLAVLNAFVAYLEFRPETESNFNLELFLNGQPKANLTFEGKNILDFLQTFLPIAEFSTEKLDRLQFVKKNLNDLPNGFYYDMALRYFLPIDTVAPRNEGFAIEREFYALDDQKSEHPLRKARVGQVLRGHLKVTVSRPRNFVAVESFIPAGVELVNFNLATTDRTLLEEVPGPESRNPPKAAFASELPDEFYSRETENFSALYPDFQELRDDRLMLFNQQLSEGVYEFDYFVRALIPGKFHHLPAVVSEMYLPENFGRTRGEYFEVEE